MIGLAGWEPPAPTARKSPSEGAEPGEPIAIGVDLTWETVGVPYQWRLATRYEIPCRVSGTVRIGNEELELSGPGQSDHSWGARDWWASDWMSA